MYGYRGYGPGERKHRVHFSFSVARKRSLQIMDQRDTPDCPGEVRQLDPVEVMILLMIDVENDAWLSNR